jgi:aldose 1-epimerase
MRSEGKQRRLKTGFGAAALAVAAVGALAMTNAPAGHDHGPTRGEGSGQQGLSISKQFFGNAYDTYAKANLPTYRYTLTNKAGMRVRVLTYGGIVQEIDVPGSNGQEADVVLGFKTLADYIAKASPPVTANGGPYFGETIGRYGNRIAKGTFKLNGQTYTLPINNGVNSLHGGLVGFGNHVWKAREVKTGGSVGVELTLVSPNGDSSGAAGSPGCPNGCTGYPAQITVHVTFTLNNSGQLGINYSTTNDSSTLATVTNLTNHSYFNLAGESSGATYAQKVYINANSYTPTDATQIPTGQIATVKGTPFDFTDPAGTPIGENINVNNAQLLIAQGYDHNWVLNPGSSGPGGLNVAAKAWDPASGRALTVYTSEPGVQFYSGNFLTGTLVGISGHIYRQSAGYTFETQHYPNSPNQPNFPSTVLPAGKTYNSTTIFQFSS